VRRGGLTVRLAVLALLLAGMALLVSCGGSEPAADNPAAPTPTPTPPPAAVAATDAPTPAAVKDPAERLEFAAESADGSARMTVQVAPGSVDGGTEISIAEVDRKDWPEEMAGVEAVGPVYEITAPGVELAEPATISIGLEPAALARAGIDPAAGMGALILVSRSDDGEWELLADPVTRVDLGTGQVVVSAAATHFSEVFAMTWNGGLLASMTPDHMAADYGEEWVAAVTVTSRTPEDLAVEMSDGTLTQVGGPGEVARALSILKREILVEAGKTVLVVPGFAFKCAGVGRDEYRVSVGYRLVAATLSKDAVAERFLLGMGMGTGFIESDPPVAGVMLSAPVECRAPGADTPTPTPTAPPTPSPTWPPTATPGPTRTPWPPEGFIDVEVLHFEGQRFPLEQFNLAEPDECLLDHYHADFAAHSLEGGIAFDPDRGGCGYGTVLEARITIERITDEVWADYRRRFAESDG
jgi:hypothetical protein